MINYLPRMNGKSNIGVTSPGWVPNITGSTTLRGDNLGINGTSVQTGCFEKGTTFTNGKNVGLGDTTTVYALGFNASRSSLVYTNGVSQVMCASIVMNYFIKY